MQDKLKIVRCKQEIAEFWVYILQFWLFFLELQVHISQLKFFSEF